MVARILLGIAAVLLFACALVLGGGALWLWNTFGAPEGAVRSLGRIESSASTIVIDVAQIGWRIPFDIPGRVELAFEADTSPLTVVAGDTAQVDRQVFGTAYDVATLDDRAWTTVSVPGVRPLAEFDAGDWSARATGDPAVIDVEAVLPGSLIITRDGITSAVAADDPVRVDLRYVVADARPIAWIGTGIAAFLLLIALVLLWAVIFGMRSRGRHE